MEINFVSKRLFLLVIVVTLYITCKAQVNKRDIIYLKNGSIIKGRILEMIPNETIKIETADGSIFIYKLEEIEKTTKEGTKEPRSSRTTTEDKFEPRGYFIMMRVGPQVRPGAASKGPDISIGFINGLQINQRLSLGVGVEASTYTYNNDKSNKNQNSTATLVPIFFDARFYTPVQRIHPMINLQAGYTTTNSNASGQGNPSYFNPGLSKGGIYVALGVGARAFLNQKISFIADGGVSVQNLKGYSTTDNGSLITFQTQNILSLRLNLGVAMSF